MLRSVFDTDPRYLWPAFGNMQEVGDSAGCVAMFDRISAYSYGVLERIDVSLPSIISAFMPKSGGTFLHNRMKKSLNYKDFYWGITLSADPMAVFASKSALALFLKGGCTSHTHMVPHPHNVDVFNDVGVSKIWVHIRDPRDAAMSAYFHYLGLGQGSGTVAQDRISSAAKQAEHLGIKVGRQSKEEVKEFLSNHLPSMIGWIESWLVFDQLNPGSVFFTRFDQLDNISSLLNIVLQQFGGTPRASLMADDVLPEDRRRLGSRETWDEFAGDAVAKQAQQMIEDRLAIFSRWGRISESRSLIEHADNPNPFVFPQYVDIPQARPGKLGIANRRGQS